MVHATMQNAPILEKQSLILPQTKMLSTPDKVPQHTTMPMIKGVRHVQSNSQGFHDIKRKGRQGFLPKCNTMVQGSMESLHANMNGSQSGKVPLASHEADDKHKKDPYYNTHFPKDLLVSDIEMKQSTIPYLDKVHSDPGEQHLLQVNRTSEGFARLPEQVKNGQKGQLMKNATNRPMQSSYPSMSAYNPQYAFKNGTMELADNAFTHFIKFQSKNPALGSNRLP